MNKNELDLSTELPSIEISSTTESNVLLTNEYWNPNVSTVSPGNSSTHINPRPVSIISNNVFTKSVLDNANVQDCRKLSTCNLERFFLKEIMILHDSAATHHVVLSEQFLFEYEKYKRTVFVTPSTENEPSLVLGQGTILAILSVGQTAVAY